MEENKNDQASLPETPSESPACGNNNDQKTKLSSVKIALVIMGVAILLGVLAAVIFLGMDRSPAPAVETTEVSETEAPATIPADGNPDMKRLRCLICDVMRKPEEFFWASTLRELIERWQAFAAVKGYAKEPERVVRFATEGME